MAMVCTFLKEYEAALRWYSFCGLTTPVATREMQRIIRLLDRLNQLLQVDYNITVEQLLENDEEIDDPSFMNVRPPYEEVNNNELVEGYNKDTAIVGRVLHSVTNEIGYPLYYLMCDSKAERFILTVHGIHKDAIHEGNLLILKEPYCKIVNFEWNGKAYRFRSVRLNLLGQVLVNGAEPSNEFKFSRLIRQRE